jgi:Raf kinase inhibitor-like YbhB/YbcL family protein
MKDCGRQAYDPSLASGVARRSPLGWLAVVLIAVAPALSGCSVGGQSGATTGQEGPAPALNPTRQSAPLAGTPESTHSPAEGETAASLESGSPYGIGSPAFAPGEPIPAQFSCDGENISPPLEWGDAPSGTASFALIADDPDAPGGTWVHWVLFNLPPDQHSLPAGIPTEGVLAGGGLQGANSAGRLGYTGPCPPSGIHRYFFKLYALDTELALTAGASKAELLGAMEGHVLAQAEIIGTYAR